MNENNNKIDIHGLFLIYTIVFILFWLRQKTEIIQEDRKSEIQFYEYKIQSIRINWICGSVLRHRFD